MGNGGFSLKRAFILAGAIIALVIGSGFATGQELVQYFSAYGLGGFLVIAVFAVIFMYYNFNFARVGHREKYEVGNDIYRYYCGKYLGTFFDYYSTVFCYMSFFVMVGGASSTLTQGFGIPEWVGGVLLTAIVVLIVSLGLSKLVDIIGIIGPIKIAFFVAVGIIVLVMDWSHISDGLAAIASNSLVGAQEGEGIVKAGDNWLISGLSYAGFVLLWFASFMTLLGAKNDRKSLDAGIIIATLAICAAIAIIFMAQVANINTGEEGLFVWNAPIPNLILAQKIWPPLSLVYAIVVFIGICATAVPLLTYAVLLMHNIISHAQIRKALDFLTLIYFALFLALLFPTKNIALRNHHKFAVALSSSLPVILILSFSVSMRAFSALSLSTTTVASAQVCCP